MIEHQKPSGKEIAAQDVPCDSEREKTTQDELSDKTEMVPANTWAAHYARLRSAWPE
jgi:hypothetical protein